jgi:phosphoribosylaminoimidazole-succinocarboxamide synthase
MAEENRHEVFFEWVTSQGITVHDGIKADQIPGKGVGIIATKQLRVPFHSQIMKRLIANNILER